MLYCCGSRPPPPVPTRKPESDLEEGSLADLYILRGQAQHFVIATQAVRLADEPLRTGKKASAFEGSVHLATDRPLGECGAYKGGRIGCARDSGAFCF